MVEISLRISGQPLRLCADAGGARLDALAVEQQCLHVDVLLDLGSDVRVTAGEAIIRASAADGASSSHR